MAGTIPLINQVPAREPINRRIRMDGNAELMVLTIPACSIFQLKPKRIPTIPATAAASIKTIWLDPDKASSLKIATFTDNKMIRNKTGIRASNRVGFLFPTNIYLSLGIKAPI